MVIFFVVIVTIIGFSETSILSLGKIVDSYTRNEKLHINIVATYDFFCTGKRYFFFNEEYLTTKTISEIGNDYYCWLSETYPKNVFHKDNLTPRHIYGQYLIYKFEQIKERIDQINGTYSIIYDEAENIVKFEKKDTNTELLIVYTKKNSIVTSDRVVLSIDKDFKSISDISSINGNYVYYGIFDIWSKSSVQLHQTPIYVCNYYNKNHPKSPTMVTIIGTNNNAADFVYNLLKNGFSGKIYCLSEIGQFNDRIDKCDHIENFLTDDDVKNGLSFLFKKVKNFLNKNQQYHMYDIARFININYAWKLLPKHDKSFFIRHLRKKWIFWSNPILSEAMESIKKATKDGIIITMKCSVYDIKNIEDYNIVYYSYVHGDGAICSHIVVNAEEIDEDFKKNTLIQNLYKNNLLSYNNVEYLSNDPFLLFKNSIINE